MKNFASFFSSLADVAECITFTHNDKTTILSGKELQLCALKIAGLMKKRSGDGLVLIGLKHGVNAVSAFLSCLLSGMTPAYIPHPSGKISPEDYCYKINHLIKAHNPQTVLLEEEHRPFFPEHGIEIITSESIKRAPAIKSFDYPKNPCFAQFSSGSTGIPKGIKYSFSELLQHIDDFSTTLQLQGTERFISWLPLYHDMGLIACLLLPLIKNCSIHFISPFEWVLNPVCLLEKISEFKATHLWMPNFAFRLLSRKVKKFSGDLSSIKMISSCAEPTEASALRFFYEIFRKNGLKSDCFAVTYAMAENIFAMTHWNFDIGKKNFSLIIDEKEAGRGVVRKTASLDSGREVVSCGTRLNHTEIKIAAGEGKIGDILIKSPYMVNSYWHKPENAIDENGWFNTGDMGFLDENGHLFVTGRSTDMIICHGVNIFPQDVENLINDIEGVYPGRNVCFGVENTDMGTQDVVILAEVKADCDYIETKKKISRKLGSILEIPPAAIHLLPHKWLLKTSSGKICRSMNRKKYLDELCRNNHKATKPEVFEKWCIKCDKLPDSPSLINEISAILYDIYGLGVGNDTRVDHLLSSLEIVELVSILRNRYSLELPPEWRNRFELADLPSIEKWIRKHQPMSWHEILGTNNFHIYPAEKVPYKIKKASLFNHDSRILVFGSCFADRIVAYLVRNGYKASLNPRGMYYTPRGLYQEISHILEKERTEDDFLALNENGKWSCPYLSIINQGNLTVAKKRKTF